MLPPAIDISRHQSIFNPMDHNSIPVSIVGAGALGSRAFMSLIELGVTNINIFDFDVVEEHNLANQAFTHKHIGKLKGEACLELFEEKTGQKLPETIRFFNEALPSNNHTLTGIVLLFVDSMEAREKIVDDLISDKEVLLVIDGRMASTYGNILAFSPLIRSEVKEWKSTLINDADAEMSPCGTSITVGTTANIIANMAVMQYMLFLTDKSSMQKRINLFLKPFVANGTYYE